MKNNFETSSTQDLKLFILNKFYKKIFVLAGYKSFTESGLKTFFSQTFKEKNFNFFFKRKPYPEYQELIKIIKSIENFNPDLIIAAGGGSVLDYAKIANSIEFNRNLDKDIISSEYKLKKKKTILLAIPTTAGSGAEVTSNAVIYINQKKYSIEGNSIKPDFFFLIPDFVKSASNIIKSSAGFDAIAQSIESLVSKGSNATSVAYAKKSLSISLDYFLKFLKKPTKENTCAMSFAANLSGKAINISRTTAPHAVSYPFTSSFKISHGHAVSLTLNKFMVFNYKNSTHSNCKFDLHERFKLLFKITKTKNIEDFNNYIKFIKINANLEDNFTKLGIDIENFMPKLLDETNDQRLKNNPVKITKKILKSLILNT